MADWDQWKKDTSAQLSTAVNQQVEQIEAKLRTEFGDNGKWPTWDDLNKSLSDMKKRVKAILDKNAEENECWQNNTDSQLMGIFKQLKEIQVQAATSDWTAGPEQTPSSSSAAIVPAVAPADMGTASMLLQQKLQEMRGKTQGGARTWCLP